MYYCDFKSLGLTILLVISFSWSLQARADEAQRNLYIRQAQARYFDMPGDASTLGMEDSTIATTVQTSNIMGNPAGLGKQAGTTFSQTYVNSEIQGVDHRTNKDIHNITQTGASLLSVSLGEFGTIGFGFNRFNGHTNDLSGSHNDGFIRNIAYGIKVTPDTSVGYGFAFFDDELETEVSNFHSHARFRNTVGVNADLSPEFVFGALLFYCNGQSDFEQVQPITDTVSHIREIGGNIGISYLLNNTRIAVSTDYQDYQSNSDLNVVNPAVVSGHPESGGSLNVRLGIEQSVIYSSKLRLGYRYHATPNYRFHESAFEELGGNLGYSAYSVGLGMRFLIDTFWIHQIQLDYAAEYRDVASGEWQHTVTMKFTCCSGRERP